MKIVKNDLMGGQHVALIVEDDRAMALALGELLASIGHAHIHVESQAEAMKIVDEGGFCYVLLDLEIKPARGSLLSLVQFGLSLLKYIRARYPHRREGTNTHVVPVLVVSGHAKEHEYIVEAFQVGCDNFVRKPISKARPSLEERIRRALDEIGRTDHKRCDALTREVLAHPPASGVVRIDVTGRRNQKWIEASINGRTVKLAPKTVFILLSLIEGRLRDRPWVDRSDLGATTPTGWKGMTRFRKDLAPYVNCQPDEFDDHGRYCLVDNIEIGEIDTAKLEALGDPDIAELAGDIRDLLAKR